MTPEQRELRDRARDCAIEYGYTEHDGELHAPPGKFEGEPWYIVYYWSSMLNGDGEPFGTEERTDMDVFDVTADERVAFGLSAKTAYVALVYFENGFTHLDEFTEAGYYELHARYEGELEV